MIPLSIPYLNGNEWKYVKDCLDTGWVSSAGSYVTKFEDMLAERTGASFGIAASNGTSALHLSLHLLGAQHGDFIIVPNISFIASANAATYTNAEPIFIDIDKGTWQMDLRLLHDFLESYTQNIGGECFLTNSNFTNKPRRVAAIMPVHVLGNMCDMDALMTIANEFHIPVVEDASESLGSYWNGKHSGTFGIMGVFSFNGNKIITTGGGGVIVTNDEHHAKRAKHLSTQSKVNPETYYHDEIGFNYRLVNVLAAIGVAQMEQLDEFIKRKKNIDQFYRSNLADIGDIQFQEVDEKVDPNCWLFTFYTEKQEQVLQALKSNNIIARPFWTPMNQLPMFDKNLYVCNHDHSKNIHQYCLSIPSSVNLTDDQLKKVVTIIKQVY